MSANQHNVNAANYSPHIALIIDIDVADLLIICIIFNRIFNFMSLFLATVRKNPLCTTATATEIEGAVKSWLRNASDRDGGRLRRMANNTIA